MTKPPAQNSFKQEEENNSSSSQLEWKYNQLYGQRH